MLWPEEFASYEELIKNDLIGFVAGHARPPSRPGRAGRLARSSRWNRGRPSSSRGVVVTLRKGVTQDDRSSASPPGPRRPGNLDVYLEILGLRRVAAGDLQGRRSYKIRHDDRLVSDLEAAVGAGNVRLLGRAARPLASPPTAPAPSAAPPDPGLVDDSGEL